VFVELQQNIGKSEGIEVCKMASKVVLIFGFGPRIGFAVARAFTSQGYKVAVVSRTQKTTDGGSDYLWIKADLSDAFSVEGVFTTVKSKLGTPSVVIYNGKRLLDYYNGLNIS
jgi:NAD(P)-dependent dehydrogenase (short-subunit alcohol dehydrogenase family)